MKRNSLTVNSPRLQAGVGLIEILVTAIVLAVGLLGLSALQIVSLKNNQSAMERSMAVVQSYAVIEAIRADVGSAELGLFNIGLTDTPRANSFPGTVLTSWRAELKQNLGESATGSVHCDVTKCAITVQWDDSKGSEGSETEQVVTEVLL